MARFFLIILLNILFIPISISQHYPLYNQYILNGLVINPAYSGSSEVLNASIFYRNQWLGFPGAPVSQSFSAHTPMKNNKIALGILIAHDSYGVTNQTSIFTNYCYRIILKNAKLALGLKAGFDFFNATWSEVNTLEKNDNIFSSDITKTLPNFGTGAYLYSNKYFVSISIPLLLAYKLDTSKFALKPGCKFKNHNIFLASGYIFNINKNIKVYPGFLLKFIPELYYQIDFNNNLIFNDKLSIGFSYRTTKTLVLLAQYQVNYQIKIAYAYDYSFSKLNRVSKGSHEIYIEYQFKQIIEAVSPRNF